MGSTPTASTNLNYLDMEPIYLRNLPPPLETFDHPAFLSSLFRWIKPERYLELGIRGGRNFIPVSKFCKEAIGVDIAPKPSAFTQEMEIHRNMKYFQMTTDQYFEQLDKNEKFDAVFIDADHSHEQSLKDFLNIKDQVIDDGFIFFHDTYPYCEEFFDPNACHDVYKTALFIKENYIDEFEILTLPFNPGITIVKKMSRNKQLLWL